MAHVWLGKWLYLDKCIAHPDSEVRCDLTDTHNDYSNSCCTCALRVNHIQSEHIIIGWCSMYVSDFVGIIAGQIWINACVKVSHLHCLSNSQWRGVEIADIKRYAIPTSHFLVYVAQEYVYIVWPPPLWCFSSLTNLQPTVVMLRYTCWILQCIA